MVAKYTLLILVMTFCCTVQGQSETITPASYYFVTFQFPPLEYESENGRPEGVAVELVQRVMAHLGYAVKIEVFPWTRALNMVKAGKADAIFTAYQNEERARYLKYCREVLLPQAVYFYKKQGSAVDFNGDLAQLRGKRIGVVSTISYGKTFDQYKPDLTLDKANRLEHNFQKLLLDRIDLVPCNIYVARYTLARMHLSQAIVRLDKPLENIPSYIAFSSRRNLTALRDRFDAQLVKMKTGAEYGRILSRYGIGPE